MWNNAEKRLADHVIEMAWDAGQCGGGKQIPRKWVVRQIRIMRNAGICNNDIMTCILIMNSKHYIEAK